MQQSLPLPRPATKISSRAILFHLRYVPRDSFPSFYLPCIIVASPTHPISAVPLKPSPRILFTDPSIFHPNKQRLRSSDSEKINFRVRFFSTSKLRADKPIARKFLLAISHIFSLKNSKRKHLLRRQLGFELRIKIFPRLFGKIVNIVLLHLIVHHDSLFHLSK